MSLCALSMACIFSIVSIDFAYLLTSLYFFFFFNDTATTEIYTLSLHDALPIWLETNNLFNNLIQRNQSAAFSSGKVRPNHETNINIIARRTGKDVNSHTVLDGIITTIMATIQRI